MGILQEFLKDFYPRIQILNIIFLFFFLLKKLIFRKQIIIIIIKIFNKQNFYRRKASFN